MINVQRTGNPDAAWKDGRSQGDEDRDGTGCGYGPEGGPFSITTIECQTRLCASARGRTSWSCKRELSHDPCARFKPKKRRSSLKSFWDPVESNRGSSAACHIHIYELACARVGGWANRWLVSTWPNTCDDARLHSQRCLPRVPKACGTAVEGTAQRASCDAVLRLGPNPATAHAVAPCASSVHRGTCKGTEGGPRRHSTSKRSGCASAKGCRTGSSLPQEAGRQGGEERAAAHTTTYWNEGFPRCKGP
jgi:hypothetical protein